MLLEKRPSKDRYFMEICRVVSTRSTCLRRRVGAVLVKEGQILATGYNGAPKGLSHCLTEGCRRNRKHIQSGTKIEECAAIHAEANSIIQCALHGNSPQGSFLYCTISPCRTCVKMIINAGIERVIYDKEYPDDEALDLLYQAGIKAYSLK